MGHRAFPSGVTLTRADAAQIKGMLARGDRQHDIASWFGVNGGRIAEIATRHRFRDVPAASGDRLPPSGPYPHARDAVAAIEALAAAKAALAVAEECVRGRLA
ncbi:hypothetical protein [Mesorhizobium sp. B263B2A]|uniref:hypothetical protein n=1 Tax=Mesorhizobium sp. B263B2A TaxID=2876669 RepID=UPI001CD130CE|nr:hypothetical protein [Mesorhizobium sp. B263B2A]MCA0029243.1 hypothetical protein [Mesorhizobium sp. B263B2A]